MFNKNLRDYRSYFLLANTTCLPHHYAIVIDAGVLGSRLHLFNMKKVRKFRYH